MEKQVYNIVVCDDLKSDKEVVEKMAEEICIENNIIYKIAGFTSAKELLDSIREGKQYDLMIMDVQMPELDGMELARILRSGEEKASIVFMSCNREMALLGYEVSAARYLAKPVDKDKLKEAIMYCYGECSKKRDIILPVNGSMIKVAPKDIYYIEIVGRKCRISLEKDEWDANISISELEDMLAEQDFIRCHQSYIVNCRYVRCFHVSTMELTDGRSVPVSKHRIKEVRQRFFDYMNK